MLQNAPSWQSPAVRLLPVELHVLPFSQKDGQALAGFISVLYGTSRTTAQDGESNARSVQKCRPIIDSLPLQEDSNNRCDTKPQRQHAQKDYDNNH